MAHNLNFNEELDRHAMFSVREKPWHNLGIVLPEYPTSAEAIKHAGLDFEVAKLQNFCYVKMAGQKAPKQVKSNSFSTVRMDTGVVLGGALGNRYVVVQNKDAFDFFDQIVGSKEAIFETAGALGNGSTIFITAKLPKFITVAGTDTVENYVVLTMSHDGTGSIQAFFTPIRIVCNNTLNAALKNHTNRISVKHTLNAAEKLANRAKVWNMVNENLVAVGDAFNALAKVRITDENVKELLGLIFPGKQDENGEFSTRTENIHTAILENYHSHDTQKDFVGTGWGVYNAVTHYLGNGKNYDKKNGDELRFNNLLNANSVDYKAQQKAFDYLIAMA